MSLAVDCVFIGSSLTCLTIQISVAFVTNNAEFGLIGAPVKPELSDFLPYLLNRAAEAVSRDFQPHYKHSYGMLRTEWRVLFHLGHYGTMTATEICDKADLHKTKVSRAVTALEEKRFLSRETVEKDRRAEALSLTARGRTAFDDLAVAARDYDATLEHQLGEDDFATLKRITKRLMGGFG
ncbi:MAG: MarR family winged helix-turn-helix transcriptional regulator [Pseudomonadota bacterium]